VLQIIILSVIGAAIGMAVLLTRTGVAHWPMKCTECGLPLSEADRHCPRCAAKEAGDRIYYASLDVRRPDESDLRIIEAFDEWCERNPKAASRPVTQRLPWNR
jgi:hypothetical protein